MLQQTQQLQSVLPDSLPGHGSDNAILAHINHHICLISSRSEASNNDNC
ncbi:MAG: hypothetical protein HGA85_05395 [Nanoarchaeota archaeon]|nr:hypothetical protein [Nanoarchaeota archaeon]